jgi:hypothetical protein
MDINAIGNAAVDWIQLTEERVHSRADVNANESLGSMTGDIYITYVFLIRQIHTTIFGITMYF